MDTLDRIYDMMYCELDDISKKDKLDTKDVELIDKFVDIIKDIDEIEMKFDGGYSNNGGYSGSNGMRTMRYNRSNMYPRNSYGRSMNGYSRGDNKEMLLSHLEDIANMAVDEKDRMAVEKLMSQMSSRN